MSWISVIIPSAAAVDASLSETYSGIGVMHWNLDTGKPQQQQQQQILTQKSNRIKFAELESIHRAILLMLETAPKIDHHDRRNRQHNGQILSGSQRTCSLKDHQRSRQAPNRHPRLHSLGAQRSRSGLAQRFHPQRKQTNSNGICNNNSSRVERRRNLVEISRNKTKFSKRCNTRKMKNEK